MTPPYIRDPYRKCLTGPQGEGGDHGFSHHSLVRRACVPVCGWWLGALPVGLRRWRLLSRHCIMLGAWAAAACCDSRSPGLHGCWCGVRARAASPWHLRRPRSAIGRICCCANGGGDGLRLIPPRTFAISLGLHSVATILSTHAFDLIASCRFCCLCDILRVCMVRLAASPSHLSASPTKWCVSPVRLLLLWAWACLG